MLIVEIQEKVTSPVVTPVRVGEFTWARQSISFHGDEDLSRLKLLFSETPADFLRIELSGSLPAKLEEAIDALLRDEAARRKDLRVKQENLRWISVEGPDGLGLLTSDPGLLTVGAKIDEMLKETQGIEDTIVLKAARRLLLQIVQEEEA